MKVLESPKRKYLKEAEYLRNKRIRKIRRRRKLRAEQLAKGKIPSYADGKDDDDDQMPVLQQPNSFLLQNPTEFILSFLKAPAITDPTSVVSNTPLAKAYRANIKNKRDASNARRRSRSLEEAKQQTTTVPNDNVWVDAEGKRKNPLIESTPSQTDDFAQEHPNLASWRDLALTTPFAVAAYPFAAGASSTAAGQAATSGLTWLSNAAKATPWVQKSWPWADAALTSIFGAHGLNEMKQGRFTPETALEVAPLVGQVAKSIKRIPNVTNNTGSFDIRTSSAKTPNEIADLMHRFPEYVSPVKDGLTLEDISFAKKLLIDELKTKSKLKGPFDNLFDDVKIYTAPFPNESKVAGITSNDGKTIYLRDGLSREDLIQAAIHELTHSGDITLAESGMAPKYSMPEYPFYSRTLDNGGKINISSYGPVENGLMYLSPKEMQMLLNRGNFTNAFIKGHLKVWDPFEVHANANQSKGLIAFNNDFVTGKHLLDVMGGIPPKKFLDYKARTGKYGVDFMNQLTEMGIPLEKQARWEKEALMNVADFAFPLISMYSLNLDEFKHGKDSGIHIKKSKRGTFTRAAKQHGMGVQEFARKVLNAPKGKYSSAMRKKANFARNASKFKH